MKKMILSAMAFLLTVTVAFCQLSFGVKLGVNVANQTVSTSGFSISPKSLTGFNGGVYLHAKFGKFGLQPEAYYSMAGSSFSMSGITDKVNTNYLSIPVLFRFNITDYFNLHAGPQFGLLLSAKETVQGVTQDIKSQVNSSDFGGVIGAGFDLPFGISGGLRYVAGFTNIDKSGSGSTTKNNIFQVYVGYRLFGK